MKIGFVGAGAMGRPMIRHLLTAGHAVTVSVRNPQAGADLQSLGVTVVGTPAAAARDADVFMSNVTRTEDVEEVLFGANGAAAALTCGALCIDFSTISPLAARTIGERLLAMGLGFIDAPVSGGSAGAEAATLSIMAGGDVDVLARVMPLLHCLGKTITHVGPNGAGQVAKACNQLVQVINIEGIAEGMRFAQSMQVDLGKVLTAISAGMAGSKMLDLMGPRMAQRNFAAGIEARLHAKDFIQTIAVAEQLGLVLPAADAVNHQLERLLDSGWGRDDTSSLLRVLEAQPVGNPPGTGSPTEVVDRQMIAYNAHDLERFLPCYTEDITVYRLPEGTVGLTGKDEFAEFYRTERFNRPELHYKVKQRMVIGNRVIDHEVISGLDATGAVEVLVIFEVTGGLISRMWALPA